MPASWQVQIDFDRDGSFDTSGDDVTALVMSTAWSLGMREPWQTMADESRLTFTLRNTDRRFSPEYSGGTYYGKLTAQRRVRVRSISSLGTVTHWTGWTERFAPAWNQNGELVTEVECVGLKRFLEDTQVTIALQENVSSDEVVTTLLEQVQIPPSVLASYLDGALLDVTAYLVDTSLSYNVAAGAQTFSFIGDTWGDGSTYSAIKGVLDAERGKFFIDRDGKAVMWGRATIQLMRTTVGTVTDSALHGMDYVYGEHVYNQVQVRCSPRGISAGSAEVLYTLDKQLRIGGTATRTIRARFGEQASGVRVGARYVTMPSGADFVADTGLSITTFTANANNAEIVLTNTSNAAAAVTRLVVRGQKITNYNPHTALVRSMQSINDYGRREIEIDARALDSAEDADYIAQWVMAKHKNPRGEALRITLMNKSDAAQLNMSDWTMGDRVRVQETQTAHDDVYVIVGEEHRLEQALLKHAVTWTLELAEDVEAFILNTDVLNDSNHPIGF